MNKIYIAGAHSRGTTMGHYLQYLYPEIEIAAYLYNNEEENPEEINGIPVIKINENTKLNTDYPVYLAVRGNNHENLTKTLEKCGIKRIIPVDAALDLEIRNQYLKKYYESVGRKYLKIEELNIPADFIVSSDKFATVYVASSAFDKPLKDEYLLADYEKRIQVGTALTDKRFSDGYTDNTGDNISDTNKQFCELTGLYWIWKHAKEDIIGLVHYRRHFLMPDDWLKRMLCHEVDVILPLPLYVMPNLEGNYKKRHIAANWDNMLAYLKENQQDDYKKASLFFRETSLYSPCNMFIMRREILDEFCTWLFPILFSVAEQGGTLADNYQNRYPGFLSERLLTYFFEMNRDKYKVVYADKNFLP